MFENWLFIDFLWFSNCLTGESSCLHYCQSRSKSVHINIRITLGILNSKGWRGGTLKTRKKIVVNRYSLLAGKNFLSIKAVQDVFIIKTEIRTRGGFLQLDKENLWNLQLMLHLMVNNECFLPKIGNRQGWPLLFSMVLKVLGSTGRKGKEIKGLLAGYMMADGKPWGIYFKS